MKWKVMVTLGVLSAMLAFVVLASGSIPSWDQVVKLAKQEGEVTWYGYGTDFDKTYYTGLIKGFEAEYGIKSTYVNGSWFDTVQKLIAEKKAGKEVGNADLVFSWSVPFRNAWNAGVVWKYPVSYVVPNARNVIDVDMLEYTDMLPVHGAFLPFLWWQVGFLYNKKMVKNPPKSLDDLLAWCKAHPGKFTYSDPNKGGSGHTFLMTIIEWLYGYNTYYNQMGLPFNNDLAEPLWNSKSPKGYSLWGYLNELEKYMYQPGFYPAGNSAAISLFSKNVVWLEPQWMDTTAEWVKEGMVDPNTVAFYIPKPSFDAGGMDGLFIPWNAPHKYAAMLLENYLLSKEVQMKFITAQRAIFPVIKGVWNSAPQSSKSTSYWIPFKEVTKNLWFRSAEYMDRAMKDWTDEVVRK